MRTKKIFNIVFYKLFDKDGERVEACIFYKDGSASLTSFEEGIQACEEIVKEKNITSIYNFNEMINKEIIHVVSSDEFINNFNYYRSHTPLDYDIIEDAVLDSAESIIATSSIPKELDENNIIVEDNSKQSSEDIIEEEEEEELEEEEIIEDTDKTEQENKIILPEEEEEDDYWNSNYDEDFIENTDGLNKTTVQKEKEEPKGIIGFFKKQVDKIKSSKLVTRITAVVVTLAIGLGLYTCTSRKTAIGQMFNSNLGNHTKSLDDLDLESTSEEKTTSTQEVKYSGAVATNDNSYYNGYTFSQLQEVTNNQTQKRAMQNVKETLYNFNKTFADAYVEEGKDIRPALSFEEVIALQQAYNNYSKADIKAIFNGEEVSASRMSRAYKDASLQLMGAYVIENSNHPVDMSTLIESEEGKAFYQRYHQMFLAAKEATGEEQLARVKEFYDAVRKDFPITNEVRTEGIAHADTYEEIMEKDGAMAVTPMIAAAEIMWQNLDIDYTLDDTQVDFLNDIGLCNLADEKFERIETIMLGICEDDITNPTYQQYKEAIIKMLKKENAYVIDDAHRELTKLDAFQNAVNWHFKETGEWVYSGGFYEETSSYTVTNSWTESETTYRVEESRVEKPIPQSEKEKIDRGIEKENEASKKAGEAKAKETEKKMQEEENKKAEELEKEIKEDEKDLQNKIDNANEQIKKNHDDDPTNDKPVNEKDLDHGVQFDDNHSNENGDLDNSVENITTDSTEDQTGKPLPDPEVTGAEFDKNAPVTSSSETVQEQVVEDPVIPEEPTVVEEPVQERIVEEIPVVQYEEVVLEDGSGYYEEIVDTYVESLANQDEIEEAYQYSL